MFEVEVREYRVMEERWLWEWRVLSRWGIVKAEGGGCETADEARRDGREAADRLADAHERTTWRA